MPDTSRIDQAWPQEDLERVEVCPYCGSKERKLAYADVQDWTFYCAPGKWTYWDCTACEALYLDPRPTKASIGAAYGNYYTHTHVDQLSFVHKLKQRIRHECWSLWTGTNIKPRIGLPKFISWAFSPLKSKIIIPFGLKELALLPKGRLMDVGCGNGGTLSLAAELGWNATGLEIDLAAVKAARTRGLNVIQGTYEELDNHKNKFDCVMCSHVLEHVHDPLNFLIKLSACLRPGGVLLLSLPNSKSHVRQQFGRDWRGLEAPRHIAIPAQEKIKTLLFHYGLIVSSEQESILETVVESNRIKRRDIKHTVEDINTYKVLKKTLTIKPESNDFSKFVCKKLARI
jgi:2-polyprenyl-3-methyl-5-hydroxy-6-metoxy-1,4-benzoquinol methylase